MLKTNKQHKLPLFITLFGIASVFLFQFLTYLPEPTYAATDAKDTNVIVKNPSTLTLTVTSDVNIAPNISEVMTGNFTATVSSNAPYNIALSANENYPTALTADSGDEIPAIADGQTVQKGQNGWGIKCINSDKCEKTEYTGLTAYSSAPVVYYSDTEVVTDAATEFEVGIGISPSLPAGTYATQVLVTASQS